MVLQITRSRLRGVLKSPYFTYPVGILAIVLLYMLIFLYLEGQGNFNVRDSDYITAFYWVVISMTTTGYGDIVPVSAAGQLFSIIVSLTGLLILFAIILPLMVTPIMDRVISSPRSRIRKSMSGHVVICGYSPIVETLISELAGRDMPFAVIDPSEEDVMTLQRHGYEAIKGDPSDEDMLMNAHIDRASYVIANSGDERNAAIVLTTSQASDCRIIALVERQETAHYLQYAGADFVISPKQILGTNIGLTAVSSISFELTDAVDLGGNVKVCKLPVYPDNPIAGRKLKDAGIRESTGANVVAVFKNGELIVNPPAGTVIDEATVLVLMGTADQLKRAGAVARDRGRSCGIEQAIIAGYGDVGKEVARQFDEHGLRYTVIDLKPYDVKDQVIGDSADRDTLVKAGIERASAIVVTMNDDARNMLTILLARNLNPHVNIIARANVHNSVGKMYRAGADYVMSLSSVGGQMLARIVERGGFEDTVLLSENVLLARYAVSGSKLEGRTIKESDMQSRTGCTIVGVLEDDRFIPDPDPSEVLRPGATIMTVGTARQLEACASAYGLQKVSK
ncbi:MAG: Calcium-gated potassium channel MthK [Methanocella sp. PtaU1.Bin125]|nr:MAG: Calcium-gated potassium channel MthK [Methanocella sp. PtaU1.Bin125]